MNDSPIRADEGSEPPRVLPLIIRGRYVVAGDNLIAKISASPTTPGLYLCLGCGAPSSDLARTAEHANRCNALRSLPCAITQPVTAPPADPREALKDSIERLAAYVASGPPRSDQIHRGNILNAVEHDHISLHVDGSSLLHSDLEAVLAELVAEAAPYVPRRGDDVEAWLNQWTEVAHARGDSVFREVVGTLTYDHRERADEKLPLDRPMDTEDHS